MQKEATSIVAKPIPVSPARRHDSHQTPHSSVKRQASLTGVYGSYIESINPFGYDSAFSANSPIQKSQLDPTLTGEEPSDSNYDDDDDDDSLEFTARSHTSISHWTANKTKNEAISVFANSYLLKLNDQFIKSGSGEAYGDGRDFARYLATARHGGIIPLTWNDSVFPPFSQHIQDDKLAVNKAASAIGFSTNVSLNDDETLLPSYPLASRLTQNPPKSVLLHHVSTNKSAFGAGVGNFSNSELDEMRALYRDVDRLSKAAADQARLRGSDEFFFEEASS
ncbi:MAG: hypothetical protein SGCHY_001978 [Lobulomycetales sp.]